jgi:hypothetical protein
MPPTSLAVANRISTNNRFAAHRARADKLRRALNGALHALLTVLGGLSVVSGRMYQLRPFAARATDIAVAIDKVVVVWVLRDAEVDNDVVGARPAVGLAATATRGQHLRAVQLSVANEVQVSRLALQP